MQAIVAAAVVFVIMALFLVKDHYSLFGCTKSQNVFVYLAWSFLQGKLNLDGPTICDMSQFHGKIYAYWPPLCAFLFMPFVYFRGPYLGDKWLDVFLIAVSAAAGWLIIETLARRQRWPVSFWYKSLLVIFLSFGTAFPVLSLLGSHYYLAQVAAATMLLLALFFLFAINSSPWQYSLAGTFWALGFLSRIHLILAAPIFLYGALFGMTAQPNIESYRKETKRKMQNIAWLMAPLVAAISFIAWYNWARFGSIFDTGIAYHHMAPRFLPDFKQYGYINPHYFFYNGYYTLLRIPLFEHLSWFHEPNPEADWREGYSIFFQSPALFYALISLRSIKKDALVAALWLSVIFPSAIILSLMGTGWIQFGARYLLILCHFSFLLLLLGLVEK